MSVVDDAIQYGVGQSWIADDVVPVFNGDLEPFPVPVRTLDALHLASIEFLRANRQQVELVTYDLKLMAAARALDIRCAESLV